MHNTQRASAVAAVGLAFGLAGAAPALAKDPVTICHNPRNPHIIVVDKNSAKHKGHLKHEGDLIEGRDGTAAEIEAACVKTPTGTTTTTPTGTTTTTPSGTTTTTPTGTTTTPTGTTSTTGTGTTTTTGTPTTGTPTATTGATPSVRIAQSCWQGELVIGFRFVNPTPTDLDFAVFVGSRDLEMVYPVRAADEARTKYRLGRGVTETFEVAYADQGWVTIDRRTIRNTCPRPSAAPAPVSTTPPTTAAPVPSASPSGPQARELARTGWKGWWYAGLGGALAAMGIGLAIAAKEIREGDNEDSSSEG